MSALPESTMTELRSLLIVQLENPESALSELTTLIQKIGREAQEREIRPEQLIIIFKQLWNSLAESLRPQNADQYERTRQRLVTLCIRAYYAE